MADLQLISSGGSRSRARLVSRSVSQSSTVAIHASTDYATAQLLALKAGLLGALTLAAPALGALALAAGALLLTKHLPATLTRSDPQLASPGS